MNDVSQAVPAIDVAGLSKRFGFTCALDDITLRLEQGEFLAIFGPNGAGKSTLLRILATLAAPTSGTVRLLGHALPDDGESVRHKIGVLSHNPFLIPALTGYENLKFYGQMFGITRLNARIEQLLKDVGLFEDQDRQVETFSRGMQQRLGIARALLHSPCLLLLDEPFTGLDPAGMTFLEQTLKAFLDRGNTIVMTCHDFVRGLECCTKTAILNHGRLVYCGEPEEPFEVLYCRYVS